MEKNLTDRIFLGETGLAVSPIGLGVLPLGPCQLHLDVDDGAKVIAYAINKGINFIDTAQYYSAYPYIRRALELLQGRSSAPASACESGLQYHNPTLHEGFRREELVICSKTLATTYDSASAAIKEALDALSLPYIDIFLLHELRTGDFEQRRLGGAWQALLDAKINGIIKAVGASTHHVDVVEELCDVAECDVVFPILNFKGMGIRRGDAPSTREDMEAAVKRFHKTGKGVFTMKVFGGGNLTDTYQKSLDYALSREGVDSVMIGLSSTSEVDDLISYLNGSMPASYNPDVSKKRVRVSQGDCIGCGACLKTCHSGAVFYNEVGLAEIDSSKCVTCGYCAQGCPVRAIVMY